MEKKNKSITWVDAVAKILPGIGAIIAGVFIPLVIHINAERNRSNQLYAEIVSKREVADSELRARMFENLITVFSGNSSHQKSNGEKINLLHLLALNFHESFNLKPLFEGLESELSDKERERLRGIAKEIGKKQEAMLSQIQEGMFFVKTLYEGTEYGIMVPPETEAAYRGHRLGIEVTEISENNDYAKLHVWDIPDIVQENAHIGKIADVEFSLSDYDMPFVDNTKLFNNARFAITLHKIAVDEKGKKAVTIDIIFFPETYMNSRDRPYLDEMLEQLRKRTKGM
ncbi:MAG: hypothetical protein DWB56_08225 [Candidatus Jettenia sp.]|uniref:Uncharacterized protein n=1 Tax=Candidatus Jettenia caeni TaxID=247490 RepID=I3IJI1_9BACT|nr:hypothetical protein [Candidatus Jettenia sp. AMX1]MBC6928932.1 hypothetical protein [Candidatus Jettenia sp.]WKZ17146.1 MAG: hypothetical protein QY317_07485 [Candidatus Jettenia caeni]KAA0250827.1 MAG: hypothetical protein EDM77_03195 [Candidatus Jettenia sp. AMX1]MCE7879933.1 hypothetical protein [Candidatus Jettenia sp. AMX1]MCQ3926713.1 hypothetical protein [Candidatus Jettenia sp.]